MPRRILCAVALLAALDCVGDEAQVRPPAGTGGSVDCPEELTGCGAECVDLNLDPQHCGACDSPCPEGELCSIAQCSVECLGGTTQCGDRCVDTEVDPQNCGMCGITCMQGQDCVTGGCCPFGETFCDSACTDILTDPLNCGGCGDPCSAEAPVCINGSCLPPASSCLEHLMNNPAAPSGVYPLATVSAYCDMTTDSGGWTLVLAYAHVGGQNNPLVVGAPPIDPVGGYSHASIAHLQALPHTEIRLYCRTSAHTRKIHFKTSTQAVDYFRGLATNSPAYWTTGFTPLEEHTGYLPLIADGFFDQPGEDRMTEFPFYLGATYHWGIKGLGNRWECDDYPNNESNTTLHQVWVR
ncbi:MAG TPA: fibrinogen-like YCDxxxxGGGW domain-containing protein [Polyangiaceae bacterium]|jgi:hypothetical protein|nr:fibrinogen-like YCDxxxxGGGW domain-containing protein [Polyangiaceae bacterium]